jgi:alkanesulfonate monooxygenase SsuD/methylene tetrahydromethanopterin reductase-like flavin-dependent oxidoreductase (luciferase family)
MDVGLYFDLRNPPAWRTDPTRLHGFTLEMCEEGDRLGAASLWTTEHHLFDDGYLTQPLTFLAAVAARTKRARLGTGVLLAPLRAAAQIAEDAALVDILSGGRLELGLGAGYRGPEFELFDVDFSARFKQLDALALEVRRMLTENKVTPPPVQLPLPIWLGYMAENGARRAGRMGMGLLSTDVNLWPAYREGLIEGAHDPSIGRMGGLIWGWITDDPEADWPVVAKHYSYQLNSYARHAAMGTGKSAREIDVERLRWRGGPFKRNMFLLATPEEAAAQIKAFLAGAPIKHVFFFPSIAGMPEKMAMKQIEMICTKLKPLLKDA